jgi:hypothetical protein
VAYKALRGRRLVPLVALMGAAAAAYAKGNVLAYVGIAYYVACASAILSGCRGTKWLLWAAVAVHCALFVYAMCNWAVEGITPCRYCLTAAGLTTLATLAWWRKPLAVVPAVLVIAIWCCWPAVVQHDDSARALYYRTDSGAALQPADNANAAEPDSGCGCE